MKTSKVTRVMTSTRNSQKMTTKTIKRSDFTYPGKYEINWTNIGRTVKDKGIVVREERGFLHFQTDNLKATTLVPIRCIISFKKI